MNIEKPSRNAIIVLDMHRPIRSMMADILGHMGCELSEKGAERRSSAQDAACGAVTDPIGRLNADMFAAAGFDWRRSPHFPAAWLSSAEAHDFAVRARDELMAAYGSSPLFALTDPAVWPLLPFWHRALMDGGCRARHVILHGHPATFAASLYDQALCDAPYAQLLWLRQMLDAEAFSRRRPRLFLTQDRLAADWKAEVARIGDELGVEWPRTVSQAAWKIDQLAAARHDGGGMEERGDLSDEARRTLDILDDWAANGENPADHAVLDAIRAGLEDALFAGTALRGQARWLDRREGEAEVDGHALPPKADHDASRSLEGQVDGRLAELTAALADAKAELSLSVERHAAELAALQARADAAEVRGATAAEDAAAPLRETIERLRREQAALEGAIERKEEERSAAEHARGQLQSALTQRRHELEELYRREEERETLIAQLRAALDQLKAEHGELAQRHEEADERLEQMTRRLEAQVAREGAAHRERAEAEIIGQKRADQIKALEGALDTLRAESRMSTDRDGKRIETLTASLQATEAQLHSRTGEYHQSQAELMAARGDAVRDRAALDRTLSELAYTRAELESQSLSTQRESEELRQEIGRLEATRDKIKNSLSWRYTAPIRTMVRAVRGRRNKS